MDNSNEQNIEQLLKEELTKLKKAVDYIEEAKKVAATSTELLEKINNENNQLKNTKTEILKSVDDIEEKVNKIIDEANNKSDELQISINEEFLKLNAKIKSISVEHIEISIRKNNKKLDDKLDSLSKSLNTELNKKIVVLNDDFKSIEGNISIKNRNLKILTFLSLLTSLLAISLSLFSSEIFTYLRDIYHKLL